jgi:structural maintenance of chromosome 4
MNSDLGEEQESEGLPTYTKDELQDMDAADIKRTIDQLEKKNENTQVDTTVLSDYRRRVEEHAVRSADLASSVASRDASKRLLDDLRRQRLEGFMEGFSQISAKLKEMYQMITMGGNAELELVDSLDPFSEGILFSVMPPKKSWKNISNLSGGEKTLSSLALVFALHHYRPTPLYVMDEIDAALDFRNVSFYHNWLWWIDPDYSRSRLLQTTSKIAPRTRSSSSFRCAIICSSLRCGWWVCTRLIKWYGSLAFSSLRLC